MAISVLVTGGAGYIGSHACKALSRAGYLPVTYDNLSRGNESAVRWGPLERGDIADTARLSEVVARYRPAAVMHFAAYCYVGESVAEPSIYYRNNVYGSLCLLESMRRSGVDKIILSSTCATYGNPQHLPMTESHPQNPTNPYGASKLIVERMLRDFEAAHGVRSISLRYFNAAGADPTGEIGEEHEPETHVIPLAIRAAQSGQEPLTIFGTDYPTPDGTAVRDYVHVEDLAEAHLAACEHLLSGGGSLSMNLGTGKGHSVLEVIAAVERVCGRPVPLQYGPRRPGDPPALVADAAMARATLAWEPRFTEIELIVRTAWDWHRRQMTEATP